MPFVTRRPRRVRRADWWRQTPWWAWVLMVVAAAALAAATALVVQRDQATAQAGPAGESPASGTAARIVVIGDGWTTRAAAGGPDPAAWPALVQRRLGAATVDVFAADGAGYATGNIFGKKISSLAATPLAGAAPDLVVVFGAVAEGPDVIGEVPGAAAAVFAQIRTAAPTAGLVVIGPAWPGAQEPAQAEAHRDAVGQAAADAGALFVDPLAAGWFTDRPDLIDDDGVHPTAAGQEYLSDLIEPILRQAID